jgi:argininosuccinate lyase
LLPNIKINREEMQKAAASGYLNATDMADYLVTKGLPFRQAHHCVGQVVGYASGLKKEIHELSVKELQQHAPQIEDDIFDFLGTQQMIDRRISTGGTATQTVKKAIKAAERKLKRSADGERKVR